MNNGILEFMEGFVRPRVQADGGEIVVAGLEGNQLRLVLMGECAACPKSCGVREWVTDQVRERFGADIQVEFSAKKRYFQDR